jgi:L-threonine kinase
VSSCFGTFGELLQGVLPEPDGDFLVTLPIARWSMATFHADSQSPELRVVPEHKHKALSLCRMLVEMAGVTTGGLLVVNSALPEGKGLASSSADLVASARAVANALRLKVTRRQIESLLRRIEPSDGVLYQGIVAYDHRRVRLRAQLGALPSMTIVGIDEGGSVDTVEFNRRSKPFLAKDRMEYARLLDLLARATAVGDLARVGAVATRSALLNQVLAPKRNLERVLKASADAEALGVVVAHSGTMIGILLDPGHPAYLERLSVAMRACATIGETVTLHRTLSFD